MSCLDHVCRDCGHEWFDNNPSRTCPVCGSINTARYFDELPAEFEDDETEDSE